MSTYLLHKSELQIVKAAVVEYQRNHCGSGCPNAANCIDTESCSELEKAIFSGQLEKIEFYENDARLMEGMEVLANSGQNHPRWQND
jgi:hypothetical protein